MIDQRQYFASGIATLWRQRSPSCMEEHRLKESYKTVTGPSVVCALKQRWGWHNAGTRQPALQQGTQCDLWLEPSDYEGTFLWLI
jgi:hypothetical protein